MFECAGELCSALICDHFFSSILIKYRKVSIEFVYLFISKISICSTCHVVISTQIKIKSYLYQIRKNRYVRNVLCAYVRACACVRADMCGDGRTRGGTVHSLHGSGSL